MAKRKKEYEEVEAISDDDEEDDDEYDDEDELIYARRKRLQLGVFITLIVVIILILSFYIFVIAPPGVDDIIPGDPYDNADKTGIIVQADIAMKGTGSAEGDGELKITYGSLTTYSGKIPINSGVARLDLTYDKFVVGNGNYDISISYEGITKKFDYSYEVDWVVEKLNLSMIKVSYYEAENLSRSDDPYFWLEVDFRNDDDLRIPESRPVEVEVELFKEGSSSSFKSDSFKIEDWKDVSARKKYTYTESGEITAKVQVVNTYVKSEANTRTISNEETMVINTPPSAMFELENNDNNRISLLPATDNGVARFDASDSYDLDGNIEEYQWEFGDGSDDDLVTTTEPQVTHTYTEIGTFTVRLTVKDKHFLDSTDIQGWDDYTIQLTVTRI